MADEADRANDLRDNEIESLLAARKRPGSITGTGQCLFCAEQLHDMQRRWCDADCRNDWEKRNTTRIGVLPREQHGFVHLRPALSIDEKASAANALLHSGAALDDGDDD